MLRRPLARALRERIVIRKREWEAKPKHERVRESRGIDEESNDSRSGRRVRIGGGNGESAVKGDKVREVSGKGPTVIYTANSKRDLLVAWGNHTSGARSLLGPEKLRKQREEIRYGRGGRSQVALESRWSQLGRAGAFPGADVPGRQTGPQTWA
jgi:hypothetical protein